ncbi:MAG: lactate racemase domain-containing protein [Thermomicrobiales bacterium]
MSSAESTTTNPLDVFSHATLPRWVHIRQHLNDTDVGTIDQAIADQFARSEIAGTIKPGQRVVLTAGSRGVDRIAEILRATVQEIRKLGAEPFVIPAMGSHGGAIAEGQRALIEHYGVTEAFLGCPIRASMETVHLGTLEDGVPVWFDRIAYEEADVVIPIGRVKPHTDFRGPVESGLMKMIAIGLGKQHGANWFHSQGIGTFGDLIPRVAEFSLDHVNIPFAIAILENGHSKCAKIEAVPRKGLYEREQELLDQARAWMPTLPAVAAVDVLIVDEIGKDISGDGADPNVINRDVAGVIDFTDAQPQIQRYIVRGLTSDTDGNATGIGMFDFALRRMVDEMDAIPTYMNMITAKSPTGARIPITVDTDRQALQLAVASALKVEDGHATIMRIKNTKSIEHLIVSETLLDEIRNLPGIDILSEPTTIDFGPDGMFLEEVSHS